MKTILPPAQIIKVHQYLYYVLNDPVLSDYEYDMLCKKHGINGAGGSDMASDYPPAIRAIALNMLREKNETR